MPYRPRDMAFAVTACVALAAYNNVISRHPWHRRRYVLVNLCATGAALSAAAASGLTATDEVILNPNASLTEGAEVTTTSWDEMTGKAIRP